MGSRLGCWLDTVVLASGDLMMGVNRNVVVYILCKLTITLVLNKFLKVVNSGKNESDTQLNR